MKHVVISASAVVALCAAAVFVLLYAGGLVNEKMGDEETEAGEGAYLSRVVSPSDMGSYGELMFAYVGEDNYIYTLDDESAPLVEDRVSRLLYASDDSVLYVAPVEINSAHAGRESMIQELQIGESDNTLNTIATVTVDPCWSSNDEVIYFVEDESPNTLYTFEPLTSTVEQAGVFDEDVVALRISSDGLLVTLSSGAEKLYVPLSKSLVDAYYNSQGSRLIVCEQYDLIISADGVLSYRWLGLDSAVEIASDVVAAQAYQDDEIFYIQRTEGMATLNVFYVAEEERSVLSDLPVNVLPQLTVNADYAVVIDDKNITYRYDIEDQVFGAFSVIDSGVSNPMITLFDYRLMIYDLASEPDQSYVSCEYIDVTRSSEEQAIVAQAVEESLADTEASECMTLEMASVGSDVLNFQTKLCEQGFLKSQPTGIFDIATQEAVFNLQSSLGLEETGIATADVQEALEEGVSAFEGYPVLSSSSKGVAVRNLQARLRHLRYMVSSVSGMMDAETVDAVKGFAEASDLQFDGSVVDATLQERLYSADAPQNPGYCDLSYGQVAPAVSDLDSRLKELGYYTGSPTSYYNQKTADAVSLYQQVASLGVDGKASSGLIGMIFSADALVCPAELSPQSTGDVLSDTTGQTISDRQLKIMRKWLTKQFAVNHTDKQAVKRLQMRLVRLGFMTVDQVSMIYDQNTLDAVKTLQAEMGLKTDGVPTKDTMSAIFSPVIAGTHSGGDSGDVDVAADADGNEEATSVDESGDAE
jgi:peptidoglycan hydrolase-like protein with peptidoglycan-binding domain